MMASVGTEDEIVNTEGKSLTYCGCFLTDCKVGGAGIGELFAVVFALELDALEHGLKLTDSDHIGIHSEKIFLREVLFLVLNGLVVFANGNVLKGNGTLCELVFGFNIH